MTDTAFSLRLKFPCTFSLVGPTFSGKTSLIVKIIKEREKVFDKKIDTVVYVYKQNQPLLRELAQYDPKIIFTTDLETVESHFNGNTLLILDDQLIEASGELNSFVSDLYVVGAHHLSLGICILLQNLFPKNLRLIAINSLYLAVFKSPRDVGSIVNLARQFCPHNSAYLVEAYRRATSKPYGYIFFDFTQEFPDALRVRSSVFYDESLEFYVQTNGRC